MTWNTLYAMMLLAAVPTVSAVVRLNIISPVGAGIQTQVQWSRENSDSHTWYLSLIEGSGSSIGVVIAIQAGDNLSGVASLVFPSAGLFTLSAVVDLTTGQPLASISGIQVGEVAAMPGPTLSYYPPSSGTTSPYNILSTSTNSATLIQSSTTIYPSSSVSSPSSRSSSSSSSSPSPSSAPWSSTASPPLPTNSVSASVTSQKSTTPSSTSSTSPNRSSVPTATPSSAAAVSASSKTPAIVGGVLGSVAFLAIIAILAVVLHRRRQRAVRRITFHRELMVQRRDPLLHKDYDVERDPTPVAS